MNRPNAVCPQPMAVYNTKNRKICKSKSSYALSDMLHLKPTHTTGAEWLHGCMMVVSRPTSDNVSLPPRWLVLVGAGKGLN